MMTAFIFSGDLLVMLFMIGVVVWVSLKESAVRAEFTSRIPLQDESKHG